MHKGRHWHVSEKEGKEGVTYHAVTFMQLKDPFVVPSEVLKAQQIAELLQNPPPSVISNSVREMEMLAYANDFDTQFRLAITSYSYLYLLPKGVIRFRHLILTCGH